ncbi:endonuclease [Vibrio parahaemolyticus]|nr:hypothetical protein BSR61_25315 [Vibrio parahaemolyticus]PMT73658.1 endonuclease [Vibrio parahaemolyticus]PMT78831.1 endonuclease [Vibrio parahaemolyticus]
MKNDNGPDLLGVCEVENENVLNALVERLNDNLHGRLYKVVYATSDLSFRGIDTAFIYDSQLLDIVPESIFNHFVMRRTGTRDILQATFQSKESKSELVVMSNHWPSRSGGVELSSGFRATAAETLSYWHTRILEESRDKDKTAVLAFGDFNDDPWDLSLTAHALATREKDDVLQSKSAHFYNLSWQYLKTNATSNTGKIRDIWGTLYYKGNGNVFDQILVNRNLINNSKGFRALEDSAEVICFPEMVSSSKNLGPIRFGLPKGNPSKNINTDGFSDHFPISVTLRDEPS